MSTYLIRTRRPAPSMSTDDRAVECATREDAIAIARAEYASHGRTVHVLDRVAPTSDAIYSIGRAGILNRCAVTA